MQMKPHTANGVVAVAGITAGSHIMRTKTEHTHFHHSGVPIRAEDWTEEDWQDLHCALKRAIGKIARRHRTRIHSTPPDAGAQTFFDVSGKDSRVI
jgi:hypothetical protein